MSGALVSLLVQTVDAGSTSTHGFAVSGACVEDLVLCWAARSVQLVDNGGFKQARGKAGHVSLSLVMSCVIWLVLWTCLLV